ncbi:MAG: hypothetical protein QUV02_10385 [Maricaulis sp.]|uniref:hypothetical protein n=1 Tax=Maricaulis sp. TaxID=1486257 RepID=UPI002632BAE6|nr:hypothetical protein [Maricaulis sp.]MDM7984848.1 hypothetical protein [Maricaulis sp.]
MTRPVLIIGAGIAGLWAALTSPLVAQESQASIVMPNSAQCEPPAEGPGATPETAISVYIDQLVGDAEDVREFDLDSEYDCRWIRTVGYFAWVDYWHYRGRISSAALPELSAATAPWIENFSETETRRHELQQHQIEIVGLYYDLCRRADEHARRAEAEDGVILINMGGPCHYGSLNGLMIRDVRVLSTLTDGPVRLRGEINREQFGNLVDVTGVRPDIVQTLESASRDSLRLLSTGEAEYLATTNWSPEAIAEAVADEDDWTSALARTLLRHPDWGIGKFQAFIKTDFYSDDPAVGREPAEHSDIFGCFCLTADCSDSWPLSSWDAQHLADEVLCVRLHEDQTGAWQVRP